MPSRWADNADDAAEDARRKLEKAEKKKLRALKQQQEEADKAQHEHQKSRQDKHDEPPTKRRRLSDDTTDNGSKTHEYRSTIAEQRASRSVAHFQHLNPIEEGSYGFVSRARETVTGEIVALKKLKLDPLRDGGFPVTALREIQCLTTAKHRHIVNLREIVVGEGSVASDVFLVMEFLEHDLKSLQEEMQDPFTPSEVKTLMLQLGSAVEFLHDHWILHRDLKTSNILMSNRGEIKLADFGMARFYSDPAPRNLTQLVVTLWYRAPELLLGATAYDSAIDIWSVGCIFGELLLKTPILPGKNETDQITKVFELCGNPDDNTWPTFRRLPNARHLRLIKQSSVQSSLEVKFSTLSEEGTSLLRSLLELDPDRRIPAKQLLSHPYFSELPRAKPTAMFPTFPSKAGQEKRRRQASPHAPVRISGQGVEVDHMGMTT